MNYEHISVTLDQGVASIELNNPAVLNAIDLPMARDLHDLFGRIGDGRIAARAVLLSGRGKSFCSGANLAPPPVPGEPPVLAGPLEDGGRELEIIFNPLVTRMRELRVPIVAAVQGAVAGVGVSLVLASDLILASEDAFFLQSFRRVGLTPDGGATYMLPRRIGLARALEMTMLGERIKAAQALDWGLINRVVAADALIPAAEAMVRELATGPYSLSLIRRLMHDSFDASWLDQLHAERLASTAATKSADFIEGVRAFIEKRPASFTGA